MDWGTLGAAALGIAREFALLATTLFLIGGVDDLAVDLLWLWRGRGPKRNRRAPQTNVSRIVVALPAWREDELIFATAAAMARSWSGDDDVRIVIGVYANDPSTLAAARRAEGADARISVAVNPRAGPTTKGDNLGSIWAHVERGLDGFAPDALLIHDAEDRVQAEELIAVRAALAQAHYAQLPVVPDLLPSWVANHYADEFAEAHAKELPLRAALGVALPTAGAGCAFRVEAIAALSELRAGAPFEPGSLTEDYEAGVRLSAKGLAGAMVDARDASGRRIAVHAPFPTQLGAALRQKTRWVRGVSLDGWDRLGWPVPSDSSFLRRWLWRWMLWRDRRALLAALALFLSYTAVALWAIGTAIEAKQAAQVSSALEWAVLATGAMLVWRLVLRVGFTARIYGWRVGIAALPRTIGANVILICVAARAFLGYRRGRAGAPLHWDKTDHPQPTLEAAE